jgi:hypothetical protein
LKEFDMPTSVENLAHRLFTEITNLGFRLNRIEIQETDTSVVVYTREDWVADSRHFARIREQKGGQVPDAEVATCPSLDDSSSCD